MRISCTHSGLKKIQIPLVSPKLACKFRKGDIMHVQRHYHWFLLGGNLEPTAQDQY
jgi:hypothetical protein